MDKPNNNKETSDEKLLKLIEGSSKAPAPRPQKAGVKPRGKGINIAGLFANLKQVKFKLSLYNLNKSLFVLASLLTVYFFYSFFRGAKVISADIILPAKAGSLSSVKAEEAQHFLTKEEYLKEVEKRNIFLPFDQKGVGTAGGVATALAGIVKSLKLVGIIWSSSPEVMIEDALENKTYLLTKGQVFGVHQIKVKDILRNLVLIQVPIADTVQEYELR